MATYDRKTQAYYTLRHDAISYSTARTTATCNNPMTSASIGQFYNVSLYVVMRCPLIFDTASIGADKSIVSASLFVRNSGMAYTTPWNIVVQNGQPDYPHEPIVDSDYDYTKYSGDGGSVAVGGATDDWLEIVLNETGRGWIEKSGTTKLMLRSSRDIAGSAPSGLGEYGAIRYKYPSLPYLSITAGDILDGTTSVSIVTALSAAPIMIHSASAALTARAHLYITTAINLWLAQCAIASSVSLDIEGWTLAYDLLFEYAGELEPGDVLVIDTDQRLVTLNGVNDVKNMEGDWIMLDVGDNTIEIMATSASLDVGIDIDYKERWV
jgi:hypothetical protein